MMNCIKKVVYLLIPCIALSLSSIYDVEGGIKSAAAQVKTIEHLEAVIPIIMDVLHELYLHEDYWKMQQLTPLAYFLSKDPTKWLYQKQEWQKIDSNLAFLQKEKEHNAYYLGLFNYYLQEKNSYFSHNKENFIGVIESLERFLNHYPHTANLYSEKKRTETITQRIDRNEYLMSYYKQNARRALAHCSEPNHFQRNWLGYSMGAIVGLSGLYFICRNKSKLETWLTRGIEGVKKYYYEHVSNPLVNALKSIFDKNRDPLIVKEGVVARKHALEDAIRKHYAIFPHDLPIETIDKIVADAMDGNLDELLQRENILLEKILNTPNMVFKLFTNQEYVKELISCLYINKQSALLQKDIGALDIENLKNAQALNIELIAVLPSALLGYVAYKLGKTLFNNIVLQKNTYQPLRKALRRLQIIFNHYAETPEHLSLADQGYVYYWIEQFRKHSTLVGLKEQKMILEDLQELSLTRLSADQKLNIISRMYYNYSFLLPNGK